MAGCTEGREKFYVMGTAFTVDSRSNYLLLSGLQAQATGLYGGVKKKNIREQRMHVCCLWEQGTLRGTGKKFAVAGEIARCQCTDALQRTWISHMVTNNNY